MSVLRQLPISKLTHSLPRAILTSRSIHLTTTRSSAKPPSDPFPLPLSNPELAAMASKSESSLPMKEDSDEWPLPLPIDRTGEDLNTLRSRLVYQTRKRGTLETDLILSTFARDELPNMSLGELQEFDKLLDEPDWDIFYWSVQKREPPPRWKGTQLLEKLIKHARNEGKVVRMMPALMQHEPELK